jgi:hypothetical protein
VVIAIYPLKKFHNPIDGAKREGGKKQKEK